MKILLLFTLILSAAWSLLPQGLFAQQISVTDGVVAEEDGQAVFTLTLSQAFAAPVTVNYETTSRLPNLLRRYCFKRHTASVRPLKRCPLTVNDEPGTCLLPPPSPRV